MNLELFKDKEFIVLYGRDNQMPTYIVCKGTRDLADQLDEFEYKGILYEVYLLGSKLEVILKDPEIACIRQADDPEENKKTDKLKEHIANRLVPEQQANGIPEWVDDPKGVLLDNITKAREEPEMNDCYGMDPAEPPF